MDVSVFLAKIFGLVMLVVGLGLLFNCKHYLKAYKDFVKNHALLLFTSFFALIIGIILVLAHNYWVWSWEVIITIISWLALVKGVYLMLFPGTLGYFDNWFKSIWFIKFAGAGYLVLGLVLTYFGFVG